MDNSEDQPQVTAPMTASTEAIAARVRELRRARGWSMDRLVEELAKHGVEWQRGVVAKLETGRRESVSVAELFGLAAAFDVFPLELLPGAESWEAMRKGIASLLMDRAAIGEPDYDLVPQTASLALALGLITPEKTEEILRVYRVMAPRRKAAYEALQES